MKKKRVAKIGITVLTAAILFGVWQFGLNRTLPADKDIEESIEIDEKQPVQVADITEAPKPTIPPIVEEVKINSDKKETASSSTMNIGDTHVNEADADTAVTETLDLEVGADIVQVASDTKPVKETQAPTAPPALSEEVDLTNPDVVPTYETDKKKETTAEPTKAPKATQAAKAKSTEAAKKAESTPKNGEIKDGKMYVLGFGWTEYSGPNEGGVITSDGDINKQVGIMD